MINYFIENKKIESKKIRSLCHEYKVDYEKFKSYFSEIKIIDIDKDNVIFRYVGLICFNNLLLFILPKYLHDTSVGDDNQINARLLIKVFNKYEKEKKNLLNEELEAVDFFDSKLSYNKIAVLQYIVNDYIENGLYASSKLDYEINGRQSINWAKTIAYNKTIISNKRPIYTEVLTNRKNTNEECVIRAVQKYVLTKAIKFFDELQLFDFNLNFDDYTDMPYQGNYYISYLLNNKLNSEYIDRNIKLIKVIKAYIEESEFNYNNDEINLYGTRRFEYIWEKINSQIFDNNYGDTVEKFPKPVWIKYKCSVRNESQGTLKPDVVHLDKANKKLYVLDAKYYDFYFDSTGKIIGEYPKTYDIVKQLAYESILKDKDIENKIINAFIIPTITNTEAVGDVHFNLFNTEGKIQIINLNVQEAYMHFLKETKINIKCISTELTPSYIICERA